MIEEEFHRSEEEEDEEGFKFIGNFLISLSRRVNDLAVRCRLNVRKFVANGRVSEKKHHMALNRRSSIEEGSKESEVESVSIRHRITLHLEEKLHNRDVAKESSFNLEDTYAASVSLLLLFTGKQLTNPLSALPFCCSELLLGTCVCFVAT